jgi:hypothetical protein
VRRYILREKICSGEGSGQHGRRAVRESLPCRRGGAAILKSVQTPPLRGRLNLEDMAKPVRRRVQIQHTDPPVTAWCLVIRERSYWFTRPEAGGEIIAEKLPSDLQPDLHKLLLLVPGREQHGRQWVITCRPQPQSWLNALPAG